MSALLSAGYTVIGTGTRPETLDNLDQFLLLTHDPAHYLLWHTRLGTTEAADALLDATRPYGLTTLLVTAHGAAPRISPTLDVLPDDWQAIIGPDVLGTLTLAQVFGREMLDAGRGSLVFISSVHALGTYPGRTLYALAKSAVGSLARSLCVEWAGRGLRVNAIAPGQVYGPRTEDIVQCDPVTWHQMHARTPAYRLVGPDDIAATVLWLARTPAVNGQTIVLDHGLTSSLWYAPFTPPEDATHES
jgi:NAD(P)-dependent dehydrogenase (short-subunit alcohol dehydrogenase family)